MFFQPDTEQRELIDEAFTRPLEELLPIGRLHEKTPEPWDALAGLGLFGVAAPEELGGVGLSAIEEALLGIALGRQIAGPQVTATLMAFHAADADTKASIAVGERRVAPAFASNGRTIIVDASGADLLLMRKDGAAALAVVPVSNGTPLDDENYWSVAITTADPPPPAAWADGTALLRIRLIEAATLAGMATAACDMAVEYAKIREQFGHPIGGFQAVKHHCANMAAAAMAARDLVTFAAVAVAEERVDAEFQVEAALLLAIESAQANAAKNIQVHGGIGFSDEADPHLIVKRARLLIEAAGGEDAAARRVAAIESRMLG